MFHATILCCQTGGFFFGITAYLSEGERARRQTEEAQAYEQRSRSDRAALDSLDRTAAYFNSRRPEKAVLELEAYRFKVDSQKAAPQSMPSSKWADSWLSRRVVHDAEAGTMELHRVELKNLWYLSKHAWESHPERRDMMHDFFFEAPLNATLAKRSLRLLEPMDEARARRRGTSYERPEVYPFLARLYGLDDV